MLPNASQRAGCPFSPSRYGLTSVDTASYVLGSWLGMLPGGWVAERARDTVHVPRASLCCWTGWYVVPLCSFASTCCALLTCPVLPNDLQARLHMWLQAQQVNNCCRVAPGWTHHNGGRRVWQTVRPAL